MAVNSGCPGCQPPVVQSSNNDVYEEISAPSRTTADTPENSQAAPTIFNPYYTGRPRTPANGTKSNSIDRQEIIRRIKGKDSRPASPELERSGIAERQEVARSNTSGSSRPTSPDLERPSIGIGRKRKSPGPRPTTPNATDTRWRSPEAQQDTQSIGLQIERPRSALHRGDFRERDQVGTGHSGYVTARPEACLSPFATSPVAPWHPDFPVTAYRQPRGIPLPAPVLDGPPVRERTLSNASLAFNFVYKAPTSPLVQSSRPDTPDLASRPKSPNAEKSRRHTFSPHSAMNVRSALEYPISARTNTRSHPPLRSEKTFPYQAHQPRRSLNSTPFSSVPQTPATGSSRRPSLSAGSPLQYAPMVGSYEESILRGRMSTLPSRPLNFVAQIGVLGKGDCKSSLRCPAHVSIAFPAVFYSYGSGTTTSTNEQPSPYVGLVDLENNLDNQDEVQDRRRNRLIEECRSKEGSRASSPSGFCEDETLSDAQTRRRRRQKAKRRSRSPKAPPGGSYRIPQQGQLQIVIKNPNKTAVKLFLIPYDLSDMEAGQKTFIRQRSYSAGPIIDMPLASRKNFGTDRPEAALNATGDPSDRPMLRYLIHLHICCPSKGRYFLYKSIRIVFANRVPDGKEKLRNEIQLPEPKYSTYKASRSSVASLISPIAAGDNPRGASVMRQSYDGHNPWPTHSQSFAQSAPAYDYNTQHDIPMPSLPRHFAILPTLESRPSSRHMSDGMNTSISPSTSNVHSPLSSEGETQKLVPCLGDPFDFRRDRSMERRPGERNESLLSERLMDLAFNKRSPA